MSLLWGVGRRSRRSEARGGQECPFPKEIFAMHLTAEQTNAIDHADGNLQLIACAGSGKTEVVAQHITKLLVPVGEGGMGLKPANIIAFTFTEKAAAELKQRVIDRCRERLPGL